MNRPPLYARPANWEALVEARGPASVYLAGGTELLPLMRSGLVQPPNIIDLQRVVSDRIELRGDSLIIGAMARLQDVAHDPRLVSCAPAVAQAVRATASAQVRNLATIGGNLLQRTRCAYFRDVAFSCNKRIPGSGCPALDADDRHAALLGASPRCAATHASDLAVALTALDASVAVRNLRDELRRIPIEGLYARPAESPDVETTLADGEVIVSVEIPRLGYARRSAFDKLRERATFDFALASTAASLELREGCVHAVRIALGGVATVPWRLREVEASLTGRKPTPEGMLDAFDALTLHARTSENAAYRLDLARHLSVRVLEALARTP